MTNFNPIRRSPLKPKPRKVKVSAPWRAPKIRLDAEGMKQLRQSAFFRSKGQCENEVDGQRCPKRITWGSFHLAHIVSRGRGGSDVLSNVLAVDPECHAAEHRKGRKLRPFADWIAAA